MCDVFTTTTRISKQVYQVVWKFSGRILFIEIEFYKTYAKDEYDYFFFLNMSEKINKYNFRIYPGYCGLNLDNEVFHTLHEFYINIISTPTQPCYAVNYKYALFRL